MKNRCWNQRKLHKILSEDKKEFREFLMTAWGGSHENEIIVDWDGEETFLLYTMNHYAAHYNADIYTEIR